MTPRKSSPFPDRYGTPYPLQFYINAALSAHGIAIAMADRPDHTRLWPDQTQSELSALAEKADPVAVAQASIARLIAMIDGIAAWRDHPYSRATAGQTPERPVLWERGSTRLLDCAPHAPHDAERTLIVPSLINHSYILDLKLGCSFVDWLTDAGIYPVILDWGDPASEEARFGLGDYLQKRLIPAAEALAEARGEITVAGYCMGGTLSVALAHACPNIIRRMGLIGTPWDFSEISDLSKALTTTMTSTDFASFNAGIEQLSRSGSPMPAAFFQSLFAMIAPLQAARKFRRFASLDQNCPAAEHFVAVEEWLSDPIGISGPAARDLLFDCYQNNAPGTGVWSPGPAKIDPAEIQTPTLIITGTTDHIAPRDTGAPLARTLPHGKEISVETGHVGLIVGRKAKDMVANPLAMHLMAN